MGDVLDRSIIEETDRFIAHIKSLHAEEIQDFFKTTFSAKEQKGRYFDYITHQGWRKFLLSVYYADLASYTKEADQADVPRLWYILNRFPEGFTVWWITLDAKPYPVGYTGWYYVEEPTFHQVAERTGISSRFFLPAPKKTSYIYVFNYSIAPALRHSPYSRTLIKDLAAVLSAIPYKGLFCAAVSAEGIRVAERFGMKPAGAVKTPEGVDGERLYCWSRKEP